MKSGVPFAENKYREAQSYKYGIQLASNYMPGEFMPHINMKRTGFEKQELACSFGLPYVVMRNPCPYDTATLNYNWQIWDTQAFSLYTTTTSRVNPQSASRGVDAMITFMVNAGLVKGMEAEESVSRVIDYDDMVPVRTPAAGLFVPAVRVEQKVKTGQLLAKIMNPVNGEEISHIYAPCEGVIFFLHNEPLTYEHTAVIKIIAD